MMKIAVDAMGGDYAPGAIVEGIALALGDFPEFELYAVGHEAKLQYYLEKYGIAGHPRLKVVHADQVVEMSDLSAAAIRSKRHSSMTVCARLLKEKAVGAVVSAGHTGAAVASTKVLARTLPGIDRPALAASMPAQRGRFLLMDAGANTTSSAENLVQFAVMGDVYARYLFGTDQPKIGLLSVGGEDVKGNELTKEAFKLLSRIPIHFVGNVEGDAMFESVADVVVCEGFTGNSVLKASEGLARATMYWMKDVFTRTPLRKTGALLAKNAFLELKSFGDAEELGGAPLLGIDGICIVGHGSSSPKSVRNAIRMAGDCMRYKLNDRISARLAEANAALASEFNDGAHNHHGSILR